MHRNRIIGWTGLVMAGLLACAVPGAQAAATLHVAMNGVDDAGRDGLEWANAFASINYAVSRALGGDTILVSNGVYQATNAVSFNKTLDIVGIGGSANTILNGMGGTYNAFVGGNAFSTNVLRGFTITNFFAPSWSGGAIRTGGNPEWHIYDCVITGNGASDTYGGGINISSEARVYLYDCAIVGNTGSLGGGIHVVNSRYVAGTTQLYAVRTSISSNTPSGGIWIAGQSIVELDECRITGNTAAGNGGGINVVSESAVRLIINNSVISENESGDQGGGIYVNVPSSRFRNNLFARNSANEGGGLYFQRNHTSEVCSCTFVSNSAAVSGGGFHKRTAGTQKFVNSIVYFNTVGSGTASNYNTTSGITFTNCITAPDVGAAGTSCYAVDPGLDTEFKPVKGAPAINKGLNQEWMPGARDLAGYTRIAEGIVDIGAYEYHPPGTMFMFW